MPDGTNKLSNEDLEKRVGDLEARIADLTSKIESLLKAQAPASRKSVVVETKADVPDETTLKDDRARLVAVITAAAMAVLGRRLVVRKITFINQNTVSGWAEAGRQSIHYSHNIRR